MLTMFARVEPNDPRSPLRVIDPVEFMQRFGAGFFWFSSGAGITAERLGFYGSNDNTRVTIGGTDGTAI